MSAVVALAVALLGRAAVAQIPVHPAVARIGVDERLGTRIPLELEFRGASGQTVQLGELFVSRRPVLMMLSYSRCPMLCSLVLQGVADAVRGMTERPGRDFALVTVSIDPDETPETARRKQSVLLTSAGLVGHPEHWPFLVGSHAQIRALATALGFRYTRDTDTGQYAHPAVVFVLSPSGTIARYLHGFRHDPTELEAALVAARHERIAKSSGVLDTLMACFRFDPASRKYGTAIQQTLRVSGVLLVAAMATTMFLLRRGRGRRE